MNEVPAWLPIIATVLTVLGYVYKFVQPILDEKVEMFRRSKIDNYIYKGVVAAMENEVKDINAAVADGKYTPSEAKGLKQGIAKNIAKGAAAAFGADPVEASNTIETFVHELKQDSPQVPSGN